MAERKDAKAEKAIAKLSGQGDRRRKFGQYSDDLRSVRRGGHVRSLDGTVHN